MPTDVAAERKSVLVRKMSAQQARANFSDLIGQVYFTKEPVVVEKQGKAFAVVVSPEEYDNIQRGRERAWAVVDRLRERNADKTEEKVMADVTAAVQAVRKERYERKQSIEGRR